MKKNSITAKEFDRIFDEGKEDILQYFDVSDVKTPNLESKRISIDIPVWMLTLVDEQASKIGVTRQSILKMWISNKLENS